MTVSYLGRFSDVYVLEKEVKLKHRFECVARTV
jgi:hypothetical protein